MTKARCKQISIANHKGGCGKTSTCVALAHGLSRVGKRVLVVDVDPQGNASTSFGVKHHKTLYHLLTGQAPLYDCVIQARPNLDIITSNRTLAVAEQKIQGEMNRERSLSRYVNGLNDHYDYVLFDCAPSWRLLNQNALLASQMVIIPVNMEYFGLFALKEMMTDIKRVKQVLGHSLKVGLIVPTFYDVRNNKSKRILEQLTEFFGKDKVADAIRISVRISEAPYYKKTIFEYAPNSRGAEDYELLTKRVLAL